MVVTGMPPPLTIGQVAKRTGMTAKTIRYYEAIGLVPAPRRGDSGYRHYDQAGVDRLRSRIVAAIPTALVADQAPREFHGVAIGWLRTMTDGGQIVGPLAMGALADAVDLSAPFIVGAALLATAAWACRRRASAMSPVAPGREP